jgi:hypothetical protein
VVAACVLVVATTIGTVSVLAAHSTAASVGVVWSSAVGPLPGSDVGGAWPASGDQAALVGQTACATPNLCFAVGGYLDHAGNTAGDIETIAQQPSAATTVSHAAAPEPAVDPAGHGPQVNGGAHLFAELFSVSCASASFCVAVGTYQDSAGQDWALVETWQGAAWTLSVAPEPAADGAAQPPGTGTRQVGALWDVDCYAVGSCVAVGSYGDAASRAWPMIDTLSGGSWTATTVGVPGETGPAQNGAGMSSWLQVVSCSASGNCAAGGAYNSAQESASAGFVAVGAAGVWSSEAVALPSGVSWVGQVAAVSCAPTGSCAALARGSATGGGSVLLAYQYDSGQWSTSVVPLPAANAAGTPASWFNNYLSVACPAWGDCVGTANANDAGQWASEATVLTQTSSGWTSQLAPAPVGDDPGGYPSAATGLSLRDLACPAVGSCVAVGDDPDTRGADWGLVETLGAGTWSALVMPDPAGSGTDAQGDQAVGLFSVGCTSDGSCGAAGSFETPAATSALFAAHELA